jgi:hypothetical protein
MDWILIILCHLVFFVVCGLGSGMLVVVVIDQIFEYIVDHPRIEGEMRESQLKAEIDIIEKPELRYQLQRLLAERRMWGWWKILVLLIVAVAVYLTVFTPLIQIGRLGL